MKKESHSEKPTPPEKEAAPRKRNRTKPKPTPKTPVHEIPDLVDRTGRGPSDRKPREDSSESDSKPPIGSTYGGYGISSQDHYGSEEGYTTDASLYASIGRLGAWVVTTKIPSLEPADNIVLDGSWTGPIATNNQHFKFVSSKEDCVEFETSIWHCRRIGRCQNCAITGVLCCEDWPCTECLDQDTVCKPRDYKIEPNRFTTSHMLSRIPPANFKYTPGPLAFVGARRTRPPIALVTPLDNIDLSDLIVFDQSSAVVPHFVRRINTSILIPVQPLPVSELLFPILPAELDGTLLPFPTSNPLAEIQPHALQGWRETIPQSDKSSKRSPLPGVCGSKASHKIDIRAVAETIHLTPEEILTFFPNHLKWTPIAVICKQTKWVPTKLSAFINSSRNLFGHQTFLPNSAGTLLRGLNTTPIECKARDWEPPFKPHRELEDIALVDLTAGVIVSAWPSGEARGILTILIEYALRFPGLELQLSQVPMLAYGFGLPRLLQQCERPFPYKADFEAALARNELRIELAHYHCLEFAKANGQTYK